LVYFAPIKKNIWGKRMLTDWRLAATAAIFCTGVLVTCIETNAQSVPKEVASRIEIYAIPSITLSDQQFLTGDANGKPVTVAGEFRIAQGSGRLPVVVMMHGSGGVSGVSEAWVHTFNAMGISTFVIDGFSGRGLTATSTNQAQLGRLNFIVDIFHALEILAKHPRVDPDRIVLMGFSRGGQAALYAGLNRFQKLWNKSGLQFAGYIPFYPDCATTYNTDSDVADRPIRIFHGAPDDYNPVASCEAFVARLKQAGRDVVLTEYPDSPHGFDSGLFGFNLTLVSANAQTVRHCHIREGEGGLLLNADTQAPFSYKDACVELNPHVGGNPAAAEAARKAVVEFLQGLFKLG
jgi:dienelactone hydrolase